jgi:hypothetical protein
LLPDSKGLRQKVTGEEIDARGLRSLEDGKAKETGISNSMRFQ